MVNKRKTKNIFVSTLNYGQRHMTRSPYERLLELCFNEKIDKKDIENSLKGTDLEPYSNIIYYELKDTSLPKELRKSKKNMTFFIFCSLLMCVQAITDKEYIIAFLFFLVLSLFFVRETKKCKEKLEEEMNKSIELLKKHSNKNEEKVIILKM